MVYISDKNDTLKTLMQIEDYEGTPEKYEKALHALNPHLSGPSIAPYTPLILVGDGASISPELKPFLRELDRALKEERQTLWQLQQNRIDIPTVVAMHEIMDRFRCYSETFLNHYSDPLIQSPWLNTDPILKKDSLLDLLSGVSGAAAQSIYRSRHIYAIIS